MKKPNSKCLTWLAAAIASLAIAACSGEEGGQSDNAAPATNAAAPAEVEAAPREVNVYSGRHYDSDIALFDAFTAETGITVNVIEAGGDALIERIASEGSASPADVFMTADAGILWRASERGIFRPIDNKEIEKRVPAQFRHPTGQWFGLSKRARIIIYNKEAGLPGGLNRYEDLANPAYEGMVCIRSSSNIYNQSLLASLIAHLGGDYAESWANGVVNNFARKPQGNDTAQIEAVAAGLCRVGVVNSYYVARFIGSDDAEKAAIGDKLGVLFPNQEDRGAHVNISGAGVTAHAPNQDHAEKLLEFLLSDSSQAAFALGNNEYPVVQSIEPVGPVAELGRFKADTLPVAALGENQAFAVQIFDRAEWP